MTGTISSRVSRMAGRASLPCCASTSLTSRVRAPRLSWP
jgi:hypothetical protein